MTEAKKPYRTTLLKFDDSSATIDTTFVLAATCDEAKAEALRWARAQCTERDIEKASLLLHTEDDPNNPILTQTIELPSFN